jgi:hypothetical protein
MTGAAMENPMNPGADPVAERIAEIRARLDERTRELRARVERFVDANPLGAMAIAFGAGYLLSGALFSRATIRAATVGSRFVLGGLLRQLVAGIGPELMATRAQAGNGGNRPST